MSHIPLRAKHLRAYQVGDGILVLHQPSAALHALEGLGCWLLLGMDQGLSVQQLQVEYHHTYPERSIPTPDWQAMLAAIAPLFTDTGQAAYREEYAAILAQPPRPPVQTKPTVCFQLNGLNFQVLSDSPTLLTALHELEPGETLQGNLSLPIHCQFEIRHDITLSTYHITCNGQLLTQQVPFDGLLPLLMDYIQILAYQSQEYLLAIHAAAVVKDGVALILPGVSGSGKSTLCVSLVEQGFECYSDELAVLTYPAGHLQPLTLPMAVKTGSWALLESAWPILTQAPVWQRPDGRQLKYIPLPHKARPTNPAAIRQQYVVFPHYDPNVSQASLKPLSPIHLLKRLATAGYQIKRHLDANKVEHLINFANHTPAYALHYANLAQAHAYLAQLYE